MKAGYFLVSGDKKVTKETPPRSLRQIITCGDDLVPCASRPRGGFQTGHSWPVLKRFGIHASPRAKQARAYVAASCDARRSQTGGTSTAQQHQERRTFC
ncbi:MAG: hypothetical protein ACHQIO_01065, partial [Nevskiales bacterium]